ncbi:GTP-binding protein [Demequina zhanjiangensis]|uniref:ATP/GTP-binding protein n=1 Tax=Demequina zhanjiangensis TaxID=3051659 RepID=A0ABT8G538_9MICO|nr:ATP/GTP-binding protein [Demequina sp. SYSU T00b26]MDN4474177.1 ATP/GTP-binding protein [Demequina sp. SYSU T00b26]
MPAEVIKVVVGGPFGAGKTTFVQTVTADSVGAEREVTDATSALKQRTTVAMDHGTARLDDDTVVTLFGTPGQERFSFMWPVLSTGMSAYVLLVDASRLQALAQLRSIVRQFQGFAPDVPFVVAANRWDQSAQSPAEVAAFVGIDEAALVQCDPRDPADCERVLRHLLGSVALAR